MRILLLLLTSVRKRRMTRFGRWRERHHGRRRMCMAWMLSLMLVVPPSRAVVSENNVVGREWGSRPSSVGVGIGCGRGGDEVIFRVPLVHHSVSSSVHSHPH